MLVAEMEKLESAGDDDGEHCVRGGRVVVRGYKMWLERGRGQDVRRLFRLRGGGELGERRCSHRRVRAELEQHG